MCKVARDVQKYMKYPKDKIIQNLSDVKLELFRCKIVDL